MRTIAFVTNNYYPYAGGVVASIDAISHALRRQGWKVYIITLDFTGNTAQDDPWVIRLRCFLRFTYKNNRMTLPWFPCAQLKKIIKSLAPDIVHVQHPFFLGHKAALIARRMRIPCIFTYHTLYEEYAHYVPLLRSSWIRKITLSFCAQVNWVIAPSTFIENYLKKHHVKTPITVVPSPLREEFVHNTQPIKIPSARFRLLYVGRFVQEKNLYVLLDVYAQLPRDAYTLALIGYGHEQEALERYAYDHYGFTKEEVIFMHKPVQKVIKNAYKDADLFIFTSYTDTQGLVLAEAMAAGTPVVALDGPGQRDIIDQGENGFIAQIMDDMVHHIENIRAHPQLHSDLQKGAFQTAQRYTASVCIAKLTAIYRGLLGCEE